MAFSRRHFLAGLAATSALSPSSLLAAVGSGATTTKATNRMLIGTALEPGMFKNLARSLISIQSSAGYAYPAILSADGYPTTSPAHDIFGEIGLPSTIAATSQMVLKFSGTGTIELARGAPGFTVVSGANFVSGGTGYNLTVTGTNVRVVFTFAGSVPANLTFVFPAGGKFSQLSNVVLCTLANETAVDAATTPDQMWDDQYVAAYVALRPGIVRPMAWTNPNFGNVSQSRYIASWRTSLNVSSARWAPGAWAGTATGTNNYVCAAQPDAGRSYVNGEMIQLQFGNANTSSAVTINSGGRGAIAVLCGNSGSIAAPPAAGAIGAGSLATLTYDAVLNAFMWQNGGQTPCVPYELQIGFANRVGAHYWCTLPAYVDDASVTEIATLVRTNLLKTINAYFEYANEVWNFSFPVTPWAAAKGAALGFPSDNNRQVHGWYGLRVCQAMALVKTAWSPRPTTQLKRVMAFQAFGPSGTTATYRFQGADLSVSLYPRYASRGFANYALAPNRPIDCCDVLSYATYYSGAQCTNFDANYVANGAANISGLLAAADGYASGAPTRMASALSFLQNDVLTGTLASGKAGSQTVTALRTNIYGAWDALATHYGKTIECYEGGHESWYPSTQACAQMGIASAYGGPTGRIATLLQAFKLSTGFRGVVQQQLSDLMALPNSMTAAWLVLPGVSQWALATGDNYSPKFASWTALVAFDQ